MSKKIRTLISKILAIAMLFTCLTTPLTTHAAEINQSTPAAEELANSRYPIYIAPITLDSVYKQLYTDRQNGINANVQVQTYNIWGGHQIDIQMEDLNGNIVWEKIGAIGPGGAATFWCGPNVATIRAKLSHSSPLGLLQPLKGFCEIWVG